ncbi:MAG TPA: hypothetical protein ENI37_00065 [Chloroflexi bacterium]|nr:hypothetical protein [Chloroflexota bacterium]
MRRKNRKEASRLLERGVAEAKANHKEEAEGLLRQAVALDPNNEQVWLWLSAVVEGTEAQRECLNRVLEINPSNPFARIGLSFLNHLQVGYEYLAARAPWMAGVEDRHAALAELPDQRCPRCGAVNPGWAYLCSRCSAILEPVDVAEAAKREIRKRKRSLMHPWASAAVLDAERAFAPEVVLASPARAILAIALGALALNLLRAVGTLGLITFTTARWPSRLLDRLTMAFLSDQVGLLVGGLLVWLLLALVTRTIARTLGGQDNPRVHFYLIAVAISAWLPITGVASLLWWVAAMLIPQALTPLAAALACGLLFFYAVTLLVQAIHTTHNLQPSQETVGLGLLLTICTLAYAGLVAVSPPALRAFLLEVVRALLLPLRP